MDPQPYPQPKLQNPQISKKHSLSLSVQTLKSIFQIPVQQKQALRTQITKHIKPLTYKHKDDLTLLLNQLTIAHYLKNSKQFPKQSVARVLADIEKLCPIFKELQLSAPIFDIFVGAWLSMLQFANRDGVATVQDMLSVWGVLPSKNLELFLTELGLVDAYKAQPQQNFTKILLGLLTDNKIQTVCIYYRLYKPLPHFQESVLIPKLSITDHLYTPQILDLLRERPALKEQVINSLDKSKSVIILQHLHEDPRTYPNIHRYILRKCYKSMLHEYSEWYIFQDKMGYYSKFIQWYCQENQEALGTDLVESIKWRNGLECKIDREIVPNPLFIKDRFDCVEKFVNLAGRVQGAQYLTLVDYGITENDVYFVDDCKSKEFQHMLLTLHQTPQIGFDAQYRCTPTKYQQTGVALLQLSTQKQIFLIDFLKLEKQKIFQEFLISFFKDNSHQIIGHSVQGDIKFIERTLACQGVNGLVDVVRMFKDRFVGELQNSLEYLCRVLLGKVLSKYEQRSNWNRRPLKKSQIHYAALDSFICLQLHKALQTPTPPSPLLPLSSPAHKNPHKKPAPPQPIRTQCLCYNPEQAHLLTRQIPKFLIDSMLKRLCSLLRNLGIDAQYVAVSNYEMMQDTAKKEDRVILTRDRKLLSKRMPEMPIYCLMEKGDSDLMLEEVVREFHIDLAKFKPLSRCVKCNCPDLQIINRDQAMKFLSFEYQDDKIQQFWRCYKCKQIYWQGNQFKNAKKKFGAMSEN